MRFNARTVQMKDHRNDPHDEWLDIPAACAFIGGTRPINPPTFYRGVQAGRYPAPEQRGANIKRVSRKKLAADLRRLNPETNDAA
jgi:hypothetical protein